MELLFITGFFCFGPLLLIAFGYWLGQGAPGWPWAVTRRSGYQSADEPNAPYGATSSYRHERG